MNYKNLKKKEVAYNGLYTLLKTHLATGKIKFQRGNTYHVKLLSSKPKAVSLYKDSRHEDQRQNPQSSKV